MKWYNDSHNNIKIEKIPYRLLKVNDEIYDSIFERDGEYYLSIKCGVATHSRNHDYEHFVTDGFKMIYELPRDQQKEIKIDLKNIENFLQEHKTVISSIPGSDISLNAIIETEYIAHRELDRSLLIKYDNYSLKDFPMEKRNYDENIIVERLLNETEETIGYEKDNKFYIDIKESRECLEVIKDGKVNETLKRDGNSIELPSSLGSSEAWETIEGKNISITNGTEDSTLKLIEIWGDTYQDQNNYSVKSIGELYVDNDGHPILDSENREQYKIEISTKLSGNLINYDPTVWEPSRWNTDLQTRTEITVKPNCRYIYTQKTNSWVQIYDLINEQVIFNQAGGTIPFTTPNDCTKVRLVMSHCDSDPKEALKREPWLYEGTPADPRPQPTTLETKEIILPCQLMKINNVADRLYWDEEKGKYIVEKSIGYLDTDYLSKRVSTTVASENRCFLGGVWNTVDEPMNGRAIKFYHTGNIFTGVADYGNDTLYLMYNENNLLSNGYQENNLSIKKAILDNRLCVYFLYKKSRVIETTIREQKTLKCHNNTTYVKLPNTNLSPIVKVKVSINVATSKQILLPRENKFDSIINIDLEPNKASTITFFEGGLDLKLTNGIEILDQGEALISNKNGYYASNDFIDLISYNPSTFTIDTMDLAINNMQICYYNKNKEFIKKEAVVFERGQFYKSTISYPANTKYCKIAFSVPNIIPDYYKIRILRDKTKKNGFQTIKKTFENIDNYTKSFSSIVSIKHDIERLVISSDTYSTIKEFDIINNLDENQKIHSYEIPRQLEPGETLSYTKSGKKQFIYKSNSTPYNSITDVSYNIPYKEYDNIVDNARFSLFKKLEDNGNVNNSPEPYCSVENYIDISAYKGQTITLSAASLIEITYISFYTDNKTHIRRNYNNSNYCTVQIPSNAHYMRAGCYVKTLAAQTPETKELIQKHVMVTLTSSRCDFVPYGTKHSCTIIPNDLNQNKYGLKLDNSNQYLFIRPYNFDYKIKDLNSTNTNGTNNSGEWALDLFTKEGIASSGGYANLESINRVPFSSSTVAKPVWNMSGVENTLLAFTKYIQVSNDMNLTVNMSIDDQGSVYLNDKHIKNYSYGANQRVDLQLKQGVNKLVVLIVNDGGAGGVTVSPEITTSIAGIEEVGDRCNYNDIILEDKFDIINFFAHNIVDGKLLTPKENLNLRLDSADQNKFVFAKDFVNNPDEVIDGYVNANVIQKDSNSKTYINRVYGGETNLTLLTVGGNICEVYFLNDYVINDNSYYSLHSKYTSGNQQIIIDEIPENARYIAIVTDKQNEDTQCSHIFLFPGKVERKVDITSGKFEMFDSFNKEIATLPYSSEVTILKNKLPDLSKLILDSSKYVYDDTNNRFIFPIELDQSFSSYYLQYWTTIVNNLVNIFVDSTQDFNSNTKQYLCNSVDENIANKTIQIENNILNNLSNNTLYLSVSLANSNRLQIHDFLSRGSYKLQLEKDIVSDTYEPYTEQIKHHPMYLTANGLTIESSSSYYGIRKLAIPNNIKATSDNGITNISWNEVIGATSYILYLEGQAWQTVDMPRYETMAEVKGLLTVKAKNSVTESELSEAVYVHSVPTNPYIIHINNEYKNKQYDFKVYFKDNSDIETGYKVRYQVDDRKETVIDLPRSPGIGSIVEAQFSAPAITKKVTVRITSVNEQGENEIASQFTLKLTPEYAWTYNEETKKIVMAWDNIFPECPEYAIRYKKKGEDVATTIKIPNKYQENARIRHLIDLDPDDEMELSLSALQEEIYYVFTKPKTVSKALDITKIPPSDFSSKKLENDTVEFSWIDNSTVETGWELVYTINNGTTNTIKMPTESKTATGKLYKHKYVFKEHGFMTAKLRMVWELNVSNYTEEITNYYFPITNEPPSGLRKQYISRTSMLIEWNPQSYVESYDIIIGKNDVFETINTKNNNYIINLNDKVIEKYSIQVRTNFLGDQHSEYTKLLKFTPTWSDNAVLTTINTKCEEIYFNNVKTIDKVADDFIIATKSTNKVSWEFPFVTATLNRFQVYEGPISTETWNTGQTTEYSNTMTICTKDIVMQEMPINTISYKVTEYDGCLQGFVYTPCSISGKIEMEINKTRIVCIGDSITAGHPGFWAESMTGEITHQYPYWLDRRLKFQYEVINKGYGSDRTYNVLNRFQKDVLDLVPQYCLIQIGTNDIYWGAASADGSIEAFDNSTLADMKKNVVTMVELCFQNDIVPILGMLIPRTQVVTDPVVKHGLYAFNDWIVEYANSTEGVNYVDFFNAGKDKIPPTPLEDPSSPGAMNPIYDGDNVYDEQGNLVKYGAGIHLNAAGYRIMAEAIPLNLFTTIESGVKMYMDEKCTIEANYNIEDKQNPFYEIEIEGMKLTRTKKIVRYIKNIGNSQVLFSIYPNDLYNLDYNFKFKEPDKGAKSISGILTPGNSMAVRMELTPLTEDSKSSIELSLVSREFSVES